MPPEFWNIRLLGGFRVEAPDGSEIAILSRKSRALVALLALNDGIAISRESLGRYLWPDKPRESQQQNLRQAVKDARRAFAPHEALEATRDVCRLALENCACDAAECLRSGKDAGNLTLLPEMPEPVFDSYRNELASYAPIGELGEAVRSASALLEWTLGRDPSRTLEMLHAFRDLIPNLPLPQLETAFRTGLAESGADHPLRTWASGQLATVLTWAGRCDEGIAVAKWALAASQPQSDTIVWTAAAQTAAFFMILRGRFEAARKLIDSAISIAEAHGLTDSVNRLRHCHALRLAYGGDVPGALALLERLTPSAMIAAHYAVCLAIAGKPQEARIKLDSARQLIDEGADLRLTSQIQIAEGYLLIAEGRLDEARSILRELIPLCDGLGLRLVRIHALEGLALLESDQATCESHLKMAMELRERHGFPLLPGDRLRLATILP